jgi:acyl-CoA hydrolase
MEPKLFSSHHLVKSEDVNHHGTLYAGRSAEWFVEAGYIAAASLTDTDHTVCMEIHGMKFTHPVHCGEVIRVDSKVVFTGRSRLISFVRISSGEKVVVEGFVTLIHVDLDGKSQPHGIEINPVTEEDKDLYQKAKEL